MLEFNGVSSSSFPVVVKSINRQMLPMTKDNYQDMPGMDGSHLFPDKLNDRFISVEFGVIEKSIPDLRYAVREITEWLYTAQREKLIFDDEPDLYYMAKVSNQIDLEPLVRAGRFTLVFRCQPYAYATLTQYNSLLYDVGNLYDDGLIYDNPDSFDWLYPSQFSTLYNYGQQTPFNFQIVGTVTNPKITNLTTGLVLNLPSIIDQTLIVKADKYIVTKAGVNALKDISGDFIQLAKGDNQLQFEGSSANATVTMQWKNKFL